MMSSDQEVEIPDFPKLASMESTRSIRKNISETKKKMIQKTLLLGKVSQKKKMAFLR